MLIYGGCFPNIDSCGGNRGFTPCAVKNDLGSGIHTYRNAQDLNCRFYVVEATLLENKCVCFKTTIMRCEKGVAVFRQRAFERLVYLVHSGFPALSLAKKSSQRFLAI